ncbi:outer membrane protein assembly factor [Caulobacter vibrioides]|uniref:Translocation and assembly module subunit TamA n=1 Tax=Caulobacter vibrioides (strain NA1000 / CB15N) TaxID=565050 RepID=A0A0H3C7Z3_CAUVN|nr:autotransporter assembly complex family protein [Caulobacter vibrioides]YP_002517048.1 outer membrane translocation and assembly protein TamA [Caulobacter vibrioides NA1000]QBQ57084.1 outer membrane protein assembly factor [synthetic Caulobacter sp. 'ethensis']ACL95140.1 outer membrane translocation and assembly protein TamA [Caulobacter vibrioides NA1000]ATC28405.1 outer membrane protein assembly factor [Caulobacter vibrioides]AVG21539.1 outer membrane protein assembly factor [Caulobacter 
MVLGRTTLALAAVTWLSASAAWADEPMAQIQGVEDRALRDAIQRALSDSKQPPRSRSEARRRARQAGEDAIAVLRAEGYYAYTVEPDVTEGDPPRAIVRITPGPAFLLADPHIDWSGSPPDEGVRQRAVAAMRLTEGEPGRSADVVGAEGRIVAQVAKLGYADVAAEPREVVVDHADRTVRPTFRIMAGELVRLNGVDVVTKGRTNPEWVGRLAPWVAGDVYDPEDVAELERRLRDTAVYDSISVSLAGTDKASAEGYRPVVVTLSDRRARTIELGAGYSTSEGAGVDARWIRYNRQKRADTTTYALRFAKLEQRLGAEISLPHWRRPQQTLKLNSSVFRNDTDAYNETGATVGVDLTRRRQTTAYRTFGVSFDLSQTKEQVNRNGLIAGRKLNLATLAGLAAYAWDFSDDILDPKRGWRLETRAEPTYVAGDTSVPYLKLAGQGSAYLPFGKQDSTVLAARVKLGAILGAGLLDVPASRRFFSGGGGSVRGYAYQAIGPRLSDNTPQGGISLVETSFEVRQKITDRWSGVAFVDAGAIGTHETPQREDFRAGAGLGVRYDLGFGPIRADIAAPLGRRKGDPKFQIYLSIGQSF